MSQSDNSEAMVRFRPMKPADVTYLSDLRAASWREILLCAPDGLTLEVEGERARRALRRARGAMVEGAARNPTSGLAIWTTAWRPAA